MIIFAIIYFFVLIVLAVAFCLNLKKFSSNNESSRKILDRIHPTDFHPTLTEMINFHKESVKPPIRYKI